MKTFTEISDLKSRSNAAVGRMEAGIASLNERIAAFERDKTRSREFTLDAITGAREDLLPTLSAELDRIRGFWSDAASQKQYWESVPFILSRQKFDEDLAKDSVIKLSLRAEYADMPAPLLQLAFEDARDEADLARLWAIFAVGNSRAESNAGFAQEFTASLDGVTIPNQAAVLAAIAVCQSNLAHAETLFSVAAGLRINPITKMNVGRLQAQSSRLVAAAAGLDPAG